MLRKRDWFRGLMDQFGTRYERKSNRHPGYYGVKTRRGWVIKFPCCLSPIFVWYDRPIAEQ